jgi:hypothetical protein
MWFIDWINKVFSRNLVLKNIIYETTTDNYGRVKIPRSVLDKMGFTGKERFSRSLSSSVLCHLDSVSDGGVKVRRDALLIRTGLSKNKNVRVIKNVKYNSCYIALDSCLEENADYLLEGAEENEII